MRMVARPSAPGLYGQDFNLGLLYFFAVGGLGVVGLLMGGWSSFNKYSLLGGLRSAAQIISYEIPLTLSVVGLLILAGFATEYSGMRFGFFFFAEYVNVFVLSALTVVLFLGGWNAPFPFPELAIPLDPGGLGIPLLFLIALVPVIATLVLAAPFYLMRSSMRWWVALIIGFVLFNVLAGGLVFCWGVVGFAWGAGLVWFVAQTFGFVFLFVWMRGTLPRGRVDPIRGFPWLGVREARSLSLIPALGRPRRLSFPLRRFSELRATIRYPEVPVDVPPKFR